MENPIYKWMRTGGTSILGNLHMLLLLETANLSPLDIGCIPIWRTPQWLLRPWAMGFVLRSSPLRHAQNRRFEGELVCNFRGSLLKSSSNVHCCMISIVAVVPAVLVDLIYRHSPYNHSSSFRPGFFGLWSSTWTVSDHWNMSDSVYGVWYRDTSH